MTPQGGGLYLLLFSEVYFAIGDNLSSKKTAQTLIVTPQGGGLCLLLFSEVYFAIGDNLSSKKTV